MYTFYTNTYMYNILVLWNIICERVCGVHTKETLLGDSPRFGAKTHITGTHAVANNNLSSS